MNHLEMARSRMIQIERLCGVTPGVQTSMRAEKTASGDFSRALDASLNTMPRDQDDIQALIEQTGQREGLDPNLLKAVAQAESGMNARAVSPAGAQGVMQLMPQTAREMGVNDSFDAAQNIAGGARYLKGLLQKYQDAPLAVAAYNAGPGAVDRFGGAPPYAETRQYVQRVMTLQRQYAQQEATRHD